MRIGERYMVASDSTCCNTEKTRPKIRGTVIYVHPNGRYATLEFQGIKGKFRECYYPEQLIKNRRVS